MRTYALCICNLQDNYIMLFYEVNVRKFICICQMHYDYPKRRASILICVVIFKSLVSSYWLILYMVYTEECMAHLKFNYELHFTFSSKSEAIPIAKKL